MNLEFKKTPKMNVSSSGVKLKNWPNMESDSIFGQFFLVKTSPRLKIRPKIPLKLRSKVEFDFWVVVLYHL